VEINILVHELQLYQKIETLSDKDVFAEYEKLHKAAKRMRRKLGVTEDESSIKTTLANDTDSLKGDRSSRSSFDLLKKSTN